MTAIERPGGPTDRPEDADPEPPRALSTRFGEALVLASELHGGQLRKGTSIPYVSHLLGVAAIALEHGADEETAIAALLHDAIEDQGGAATERLIQDRFGAQVATIVRACSDTDKVPKPPWRARKADYLVHLASADGATLLVSASDKLHNARTILADLRADGPSVWDRFSGGRDGTLWYYRALVTAFRAHPDHRPGLIDELDRTVTAIEGLARGLQPPGRHNAYASSMTSPSVGQPASPTCSGGRISRPLAS